MDIRSLLTVAEGGRTRPVWLADVDDTLTDTERMHENAAPAVVAALRDMVSDAHARAVADRFAEIFRELLASHQNALLPTPASAPLHARVAACQADVARRHGAVKKFSREVILALAAEDCAVRLTAEQISRCADNYWLHLQEHAIFFPGALRLCRRLARLGVRLYLFTSSDARLVLKADGQFHYDPERSYSFKAARLAGLRAQGLSYRRAFIGDPVDKPAPEFFDMTFRGIEEDLGGRLSVEHLMVMGDSYASDLEVPLAMGRAAAGLLYKSGQKEATVEWGKRLVSLGNWDIITDLLSGPNAG